MPTEIKTGTSLLTMVNVFETTPETQKQLVDALHGATEAVICKQPGFVSANFHVSRDGLRVVNYAQWQNVESLQAMFADPVCKQHIEKAGKIAQKIDVHYYDVFSVTHAKK